MKVWTEAQNVDTFTPSMNLQDGDELVLLEPEEHLVFTSGIWNETWGGKTRTYTCMFLALKGGIEYRSVTSSNFIFLHYSTFPTIFQ